jgi:hypothetical protein
MKNKTIVSFRETNKFYFIELQNYVADNIIHPVVGIC